MEELILLAIEGTHINRRTHFIGGTLIFELIKGTFFRGILVFELIRRTQLPLEELSFSNSLKELPLEKLLLKELSFTNSLEELNGGVEPN